MIKNNSLNKDIIENDSDDELQTVYIKKVFHTHLFLVFKLISYLSMRVFVFFFEDFKKDDVLLNQWILLALILFYIFLQLVYGFISEKIDRGNLIIFNLLGFSVEFLLLINVEFTPVLYVTMISLIVFYLLTGFFARFKNRYDIFFNFVMMIFCAIISNILFFVFFQGFFKDEKLGYFKYNVFIGSYIFAFWSILYFSQRKNISFLKISFEIGSDFFKVITTIFYEIKAEFNLENTNSASFNY